MAGAYVLDKIAAVVRAGRDFRKADRYRSGASIARGLFPDRIGRGQGEERGRPHGAALDRSQTRDGDGWIASHLAGRLWRLRDHHRSWVSTDAASVLRTRRCVRGGPRARWW